MSSSIKAVLKPHLRDIGNLTVRRVLPAMAAVRKTADLLEGIVADDLWPLATYQEMLFIM